MFKFFKELEATSVKRWLSDEVLHPAYERLRNAATLPNPILPYIQKILEGPRGLSRKEISLLLAYTQFRSAPTIAEIGSLGVLFARAALPRPMKGVLSNLADEVSGENSHVDLLYSGINQFGERLNVPVLGHFSLNVTKLLLKARREMNCSDLQPVVENLAVLKEKYANDPIFRTRIPLLGSSFESCFGNHASTISDFLDILPADCDVYEKVVRDFCKEDFSKPNDLTVLSSGLIRLALRESSSAGPDGVVGIHQSVTEAYAGYFNRHEFKSVAKWADVHIGLNGVEKCHEEDSINLAIQHIALLDDPSQLAFVFNREAQLIEVRNSQASAFLDRMKIVREGAEDDDYIPPNNHPKPIGFWRNIASNIL